LIYYCLAKNSLTAQTTTKLAGTIIKFEKFVGRTIRILNGKYQFLLKKVGSGIGIAGREVAKFAREMAEVDWVEFIGKIKNPKQKELLQRIRESLKSCKIIAYNTTSPDLFFAIFGGIKTYALNPCKLTSSLANELAKKLGYSKTKFISSGQSVYYNSKAKKAMQYITPDIDGHNGGVWKAASSPENLKPKTTRTGTFNEDLTIKIGD
jgi:Novel toxin 21